MHAGSTNNPTNVLAVLKHLLWTTTTKRLLRAIVHALFRALYKKITGQTYKPKDHLPPPPTFK